MDLATWAVVRYCNGEWRTNSLISSVNNLEIQIDGLDIDV
jgi:hypothetical protein